MSLSATVSAMAAAGCTPEQIAAVVRADEDARAKADEARRAARREGNVERQRRKRALEKASRHACNAVTDSDDALQIVTERDALPEVSPKDNISNPLPNPSQPSLRSGRASAKTDASPLEILGAALSPEIAAGVVEHRRRLKKPLTALAAEGLAKAFVATGRPDDAARMMVEQGWQGFRADWFERAMTPTRGGAPPGQSSRPSRDTYAELALGISDYEPASYPAQTFDAPGAGDARIIDADCSPLEPSASGRGQALEAYDLNAYRARRSW